jgi:squalene-hopene/tetraprenyl-beta-curcumene cyclase
LAQSVITPEIQQEIEITTESIGHLQTKWPSRLSLDLGRQKTYYDGLPYLFLSAFPSLTHADVRPFNLAVRLFSSSIFIYDKLMDRQEQYNSIENGLRVQAMQLESYRQLHRLFGAESVFWERFQSYVAEYAQVCLQEQAFQSGQRSWSEYTEAVAFELAIGKAGIAKATIAGLASLAGTEQWLEPLNYSIDCYNIAGQMADDLQDWKEDLQIGFPSLLISRVIDRPLEANPDELEREIGKLSRRIYYEGHTQYILDIALQSLDRAIDSISEISELGWHLELQRFRRYCQSLADDIHQIITANLRRARQ